MTGGKRSSLRAEITLLKSEKTRLEKEVESLRNDSLRTIPAGSKYALLLDAVHVARDVGESPPSTDGNARGYALASLSRWATNVQAFMLLVKVGLLTEAYGVARMGSEVAINLCWVASGQSEQFPSTDTRATALIRDDTYRTRVWFEEMKKHGHLPKGYDDSTEWGRALHQAKRVEGLPNIEQRANCTPATKELYAFAYRGESGAVHSSAVVLGSRAAGQAPFPAALMLGNVLVASMLILAGVADLLDESRLGEMAKRIRVEVRAKAPGA